MPETDRTASLMTPAKLAQAGPTVAASSAAWLDQMALDVGHAQVRRIAQLQEDLRAHAQAQDFSGVAGELARVGQALPQLDFGLLQARGWWARVRGQGRGGASDFVAQFRRSEEAVDALAAQNQLLRKRQLPQAAADRALLELDVESHALDQIIDQGSRWLHDMRSQLKARQSGAAGPAALRQLDDDTARCELLVARLKVLRAIASAAQQARQQAQGTAARRAALLKLLQHALDRDVKAWHREVSAVVAGVEEGSAAQDLEAPMASHRDLQLCIKQAVADCAQLQGDEQALADQIAALAGHLHAAA
jgi:hypothetical protein